MSDKKMKHMVLEDVYGGDRLLQVVLQRDHAGSIIMGDSPVLDFGPYNIIIENRHGEPWLLVWLHKDFGNDPTYEIELGTVEP